MKTTRKQISRLTKEFPHISRNTIEVEAREYKTERGLLSRLQKLNDEAEQKHCEPIPIYIEIEVEWHKSHTWGMCPRVEMRWEDAEGHWHYDEKAGYASGYGYDKHSAAVAEALNKHFKNLLYSARNRDFKKAPYGIPKYEGSFPHFEGGIGMSCYPLIMRWLGYTMKHTADGRTYDKWVIVKNSERKRFDF